MSEDTNRASRNNVQDTYIKIHQDEITGLRDDVKQLLQDVATLKVKAGVWGLIGGSIPAMVTIAIIILRGYL